MCYVHPTRNTFCPDCTAQAAADFRERAAWEGMRLEYRYGRNPLDEPEGQPDDPARWLDAVERAVRGEVE